MNSTDAVVEAALHARVPGGAEVWVWLPQEDAFTPSDLAREIMRCAIESALAAYQQAAPTPADELEKVYGALRWIYRHGMPVDRSQAVSEVFNEAFASHRIAQAGMPDPRPSPTPAEPTDEARELLTQAGQCAPAPGPDEVVGFVPVSHALRAITAALAERDAAVQSRDFARKAASEFMRRCRDLEAKVVELEKLVHIPGVWRCAKCNFRLAQSNLNARDGSVTDRDEPGTKCPNDGSPMWRVTYRDEAAEDYKRWKEQVARATAAEAKFSGSGHVFFNPDTGEEYATSHPVESGEVTDAEDVRRSTMQEDALHDACQAEWQKRTAAEAKVAAITLERDETREQFDAHVAWASDETGKLEAKIAVLTEAGSHLAAQVRSYSRGMCGPFHLGAALNGWDRPPPPLASNEGEAR